MSKSSNHALEVEQEWLDRPEFQHFIDTFDNVRWDYNMQDDYGVWKTNSDRVALLDNAARANPELRKLYEYLVARRRERLGR